MWGEHESSASSGRPTTIAWSGLTPSCTPSTQNSFEFNFDEQVVERERQAIHTLLASPVLRQSEFICYFSFPKNLNLGFMQESEVTNEILVRLGLRKTDKADTTPTKFPQQRIKVITDYKALLHSIGVDTTVHKILAPKKGYRTQGRFLIGCALVRAEEHGRIRRTSREERCT